MKGGNNMDGYKYEVEIASLWENNKENFVGMFNLNYSQEQINTIFYAALSPNSRAAFVRHKYNITKEGPVNQKRKAESTYAGIEEHFSGLYFVGMVGINPITKQILYMVKIGQAQDIGDRMRQYLSMNPLIYHNNCSLPVRDFDDKNKWERNCHKYLDEISIDRPAGSREWFEVTEKDYRFLCDALSNELNFLSLAARGKI
jgi:hypothetical protein